MLKPKTFGIIAAAALAVAAFGSTQLATAGVGLPGKRPDIIAVKRPHIIAVKRPGIIAVVKHPSLLGVRKAGGDK
jgi:hypothetical protein